MLVKLGVRDTIDTSAIGNRREETSAVDASDASAPAAEHSSNLVNANDTEARGPQNSTSASSGDAATANSARAIVDTQPGRTPSRVRGTDKVAKFRLNGREEAGRGRNGGRLVTSDASAETKRRVGNHVFHGSRRLPDEDDNNTN